MSLSNEEEEQLRAFLKFRNAPVSSGVPGWVFVLVGFLVVFFAIVH